MDAIGLLELSITDFLCFIAAAHLASQTSKSIPRKILNKNSPTLYMDDLQFENSFRFSKDDMVLLLQALHIPVEVQLMNTRHTCSGEMLLLVVLNRLHYPQTLLQMEQTFGISHQKLSRIFNHGINILYDLFKEKIDFDGRLINQRKQAYADAVWRKSEGAIRICIGFIDGTLLKHCRPRRHQRAIYSGHKRVHALKFQALTLPDGMIGSLYGPVAGRRHDSTMFAMSGLLGRLNTNIGGFCIYGDAGYSLSPVVLCPYKGLDKTPYQVTWNTSMAKVRISVEWGFSVLTSLWAHVAFEQEEKYGFPHADSENLSCSRGTNKFAQLSSPKQNLTILWSLPAFSPRIL